MGLSGKERRAARVSAPPPPREIRIGLGGGGAPLFSFSLLSPLSFSLSASFLLSPSWKRKGSPTRIGNPSWTPPMARHSWSPASSSPSFIYVARGTPKHNRQSLSRVWFPPP